MSKPASKVRIPKFVELVNGHSFSSELFSSEGGVPLVRMRDLVQTEFETFVPESSVPESAYLNNGDIIIGMSGDFNVLLWNRGRAALNQRLCYLRAKDNCDPRFISYSMPSEIKAIREVMPSTTVKNMSSTEILTAKVLDLPLDKQRRIADCLDRETGEIDAMIDKLGELHRELKVRRERVIHETFFDDDFECLPTPLHALADSEDHMRIPLKAEDRGSMQGEYPYYGASGIIDHLDSYIWDDATRVLISEDGANLVARSAPIAFIADGKFWVNNHAHVLKAKSDVDARLIVYSMAVTDISHSITGSAQPKLTADALWRLKVPFPSDFAKSKDLADHLDDVTSKIDAMLSRVAELKGLLTERRAALITDVVTGRKEVA